MTTFRTGGTAAFFTSAALCAVLLAGCSAAPTSQPEEPTDPGTGSSAAPVDEAEGTGEGTNGVDWAPSDDICDLESQWTAIALKLDEGQGQETPAPAFGEALALAEGFAPSPSISEDWAQVLVLLRGYVEVLGTGDQAAIDTAYPQKILLVDVRIRYNFAFLDFCD